MSVLTILVIIILSVVFMECFAWWAHKYIMHGFGWAWHESHHTQTTGPFEKNDLYAVVFSVFAMGLFIAGSLYWQPLWYIGVGISIYGILYSLVHDGLVHQRFPFRIIARKGYLKRLVQAHKLHHAVDGREGCVSFGFLYAPDPKHLKAKLKQHGTLTEKS